MRPSSKAHSSPWYNAGILAFRRMPAWPPTLSQKNQIHVVRLLASQSPWHRMAFRKKPFGKLAFKVGSMGSCKAATHQTPKWECSLSCRN